MPGVHIYGDPNPTQAASRLGVIPLLIEGISHFKVSAILGYEFGIGVRSGCFCAHPYILYLLGLSEAQARGVRDHMLAGDRSEMPGMIRVSFGLYNNLADIEAFLKALELIIAGKYQGEYTQNIRTGEYKPLGWQTNYEAYFSLVP